MDSEQEQITQKTYYMLTRLHTWPEFSNHTASEGASANSLEAIHDGIHVYVHSPCVISSEEHSLTAASGMLVVPVRWPTRLWQVRRSTFIQGSLL